ncbi:hypothetical protein VCUG_02395 [Vavraia culicis subsp. floridensis]|uniref:ABC transporter domain-containing protein n=1 Tax=Vavraia culicis (isolate floridensis) TaxID=948595 RepID=L2GR31_VAVCU|nr:uncharacterized protein VCUG_02395 [Vavraia culicis subsp. floridensis]ELA46111.1 hypothetical protein VCUG_02395 [Vavraia culicis subsp. floridensis]
MNIHLLIFKKYVIYNTTLALFLPPIFTCIVLSKYLKIYTSVILKDIGQAIEDSHTVSRLIIKLGVCYVLYAFFNEIYDFIAANPIQKAARHASNDFLRNCLNARERLHEYSSGEVGRTLIRSADAVSDLIDITLLEILPLLVTFVLAFTEMYRRFGYVALVYNVVMLITYIIITCAITRYRMMYRRKSNMYENKAHAKCLECVRNVDTITVYGTAQLELGHYDDVNRRVQFYGARQYQSLALLNFTQKVILYMFMVTYLYTIRKGLGNDQLLQYFSICGTIVEELSNLGCIYHRFSKAIVDLNSPFLRDMADKNEMGANDRSEREYSRDVEGEPRTEERIRADDVVETERDRTSDHDLAVERDRTGDHDLAVERDRTGDHDLAVERDRTGDHDLAVERDRTVDHDLAVERDRTVDHSSEDENTANEDITNNLIHINHPTPPNNVATTQPILQFRNVSISHKNTPLLTNLTFTIAQRTKAAIIGPNGAGKSSIIKAILELTPYTGHIDRKEHIRLTYAGQEPQLFANTVLYNITYGSTAKLRCAASMAMRMGVHKDILRMRGYGCVLGENARNLSGGERQKIVLLRNVVYGMCSCGDDVECASCEGCMGENKLGWCDEEEKSVKIRFEDESSTMFKNAEDESEATNTNAPYEMHAKDDAYQNISENKQGNQDAGYNTRSDETFGANQGMKYETCGVSVPHDSAPPGTSTLMVLDEATSAMDRSSEYNVIKRLFKVGSKCTILMVIHNLSILHLFDTVIYVENELEIGSFDQLIEKKGKFCSFYERMKKQKEQ